MLDCTSGSGSLSRSAVVASVGGKTALALGLSGFFLIIVVLFLTPLLKPLPFAVLAAIVCVALRGLLLQVRQGRALWLIRKEEGVIWFISFVATLLLGVELGIYVSVCTDIALLFWKMMTPKWQELGLVPGVDGVYRCVSRYSDLITYPRVTILRYNNDMLYCAAENFADTLVKRGAKVAAEEGAASSAAATTTVAEDNGGEQQPSSFLVIDLATVSRTDTTALKALEKAVRELSKKRVGVLLAGSKGNVRDTMLRYGIVDLLGWRCFFPNVHLAVQHALQQLVEPPSGQS
jgi:SulP family sulfate permease